MATVAQPQAPAAPGGDYERLERALAGVEAPFALVDMDAFWQNGEDMLRRAGGKPIRVASKSVRCRPLLERILARDPGFRGLLTYTLPETLWLAEQGFDDLLIAYPTTDRTAIAKLARLTAERPDSAPTLMVDSTAHLDLIQSAIDDSSTPVRVAIELDVNYWALGGRVKIGPKRSAIRTPDQAVALAREIERRPGVRLVGMMAYEGHIAGLGDRPPGKRLQARVIEQIQRRSAAEIRERRAAVVAAVSQIAPLEFVNGGGTGSLHTTSTEPAVTELAAGSGFYAPTLFDAYSAFELRPGRDVRAGGRPQARPFDRDRARRRLPRLGARRREPPPLPLPPRRPAPRPLRGRRRGSDAAARRGRPRACGGRSRLLAPHEGGRAVRALQQPPPGRGRPRRGRGPHLPRRRPRFL